MSDNGKAAKPAPKKAPAKKRRLRVKLENLHTVDIVGEDGELFYLAPHRPHGVYVLQRKPK